MPTKTRAILYFFKKKPIPFLANFLPSVLSISFPASIAVPFRSCALVSFGVVSIF